MSSEIERATDLRKVLEERLLDSRMELTLREVLGIAKKEFHDGLFNLVKRKRLSSELKLEKLVKVRTALIDEVAVEDEYAKSHYMRPH